MAFDLAFFELFIFLYIPLISAKIISFLISIIVKYIGNKYWAFGKHGLDGIQAEITRFMFITLVGLAIDVLAFYYFTKTIGPQFGTPLFIWQKLGVIFAAAAAALWNFFGYKFIVFRK